MIERVLRQRPAVRGTEVTGHPARAVAGARRWARIERDHQVRVSEFRRLLGPARRAAVERQLGEALIWGAEPLRHIDQPARLDKRRNEPARPGELPRRGQDGGFGAAERGGEHRPGVAAMRGKDQRIVPGQAKPGERERDGRGRRDNAGRDAAFGESPDDPEKARVTRRQHGNRPRMGHDGAEGSAEGAQRASGRAAQRASGRAAGPAGRRIATDLDAVRSGGQLIRRQPAPRTRHAPRVGEGRQRWVSQRAAVASDDGDRRDHEDASPRALPARPRATQPPPELPPPETPPPELSAPETPLSRRPPPEPPLSWPTVRRGKEAITLRPAKSTMITSILGA